GEVRSVGPHTRKSTTDSMGNYCLRLRGGDYDVTARAFARVRQTVAAVPVSDVAPTIQNFSLQTAPNRQVSGVVATSGGTPLENVELVVLGTPLAPVRTDAAGAYVFPMVPEEIYQIRAGSSGCLISQTQQVTVDGDRVVNFEVNRKVDGFGYTCDDGVTFDWIPGDVATSLFGDDESLAIPLPFAFTFYGETY